jgi:hypothetical protein
MTMMHCHRVTPHCLGQPADAGTFGPVTYALAATAHCLLACRMGQYDRLALLGPVSLKLHYSYHR